MPILVINAGSSSIKYQYIDTRSPEPLCSGLLERIGQAEARVLHLKGSGAARLRYERTLSIPDHADGLRRMADLLIDPEYGVVRNLGEIRVIGHRVVHGGEDYSQTVRIDGEVKQAIRDLCRMAPLHNPVNLLGIEVAEELFPDAVQVAVFDTAFHQTLPDYAFRYAIPESLYRKEGIRKFGFHGISHQYVSARAAAFLGAPEARLVTLHLGNGCSMSAVKAGRCLDTSMGFGPLDGLVMGTRSGKLDPTILFYLNEQLGYGMEEINQMLNKESGLAGLCGLSDMRDVQRAAEAGDARAELAAELFSYRIRTFIGSYAAVLNGLDALVFTAGIGENSAWIRERICRNLEALGIRLDPEANAAAHTGIRRIGLKGSSCELLVVPTNEELQIALETEILLEGKQP